MILNVFLYVKNIEIFRHFTDTNAGKQLFKIFNQGNMICKLYFMAAAAEMCSHLRILISDGARLKI